MPVQWGTNPAVSQSVFLLRGLHAARPAAAPANQDYYYLETDTGGGTLFQSSGSAWVQVAGAVTDTDVNTFAGLTDVDTTGQVDQQVYAHRASDGKVYPLAGVVGDGSSGVTVAKSLTAGGAGSPTLPTYHQITGNLELDSAQGDYLDLDSTLLVQQPAVLDGTHALPVAAWVARSIDRTLDVPTVPILLVENAGITGPAPLAGEPVARFHGGVGDFQINAAGGIGTFGTAAPTAAPTVTGALSTVTDTNAKDVLDSLISALLAFGLVINGTT